MSEISNSDVIGRKPFDLQEAVVLLDVYISAKNKGNTNTDAANIASNRLRDLAIRRGMKIDNAFRSPMGLQNRLRSIENIYEDHEAYAVPDTQIFREAVALYKNNRSEFDRLLGDASTTSIEVNGSVKQEDSIASKASGNGIAIEEMEAFLKASDLRGASVHELIDAVQPGATVSLTKSVLDASNRVIEMPNGRYVHVDAFVDLDEAKAGMRNILRTHFAQFGGYSNNKLLFGAASHDLSMFLNDNDCEDIDSVYALAQFFFGKNGSNEKFTFSYPHIFECKPDYPLTLKGLMINFSRMNAGVLNADEAKNYIQRTMLSYGSLNPVLAISSSDTFLLYDSSRYLLAEKVGINAEWKQAMHKKLDDLFRRADVAFVIPRDINQAWLNSLPALPHDLKWTALLLQDVLKKFPDIGFRPVTPDIGQSTDTIAAAIVPTDSAIQSFPDVVTLFMHEKHTLPKRMSCEELRNELRKAGMLEGNELMYALPRALDDYRFSWTDENRMVLVRGN